MLLDNDDKLIQDAETEHLRYWFRQSYLDMKAIIRQRMGIEENVTR